MSFPKGNLLFLLAPTSSNARLRVDTKYGYCSYSMQDKSKALDLFASEGIRLRVCRDIYDDGTVVAGEPLSTKVKP